MKKIIHLSDLHVGYQECGRRYQKIVDQLISKFSDKADKFVIVITGDLVDNAHIQEDYVLVKEGFNALKQVGFKDILVIPGNHDYGTGSKGDKKFVKIFQEHFFNDTNSYPRKVIIENCAFIGLDSIAEELHWYDALWSEGELGDEQLGRLSALLEGDDVRACMGRVIYFHHHPFDARPLHELKDSKKLKKVLEDIRGKNISIDALLYGHNHAGESHNGHWGISRCYDGGSATLKPRPAAVSKLPWFQVKSSIRVIDLSEEDANLDITLGQIQV